MFKVGDTVRCIDNNNGNFHHIQIGKIYTITKINEEGKIIVDNIHNFYYAHRFEFVSHAQSPFQKWEKGNVAVC